MPKAAPRTKESKDIDKFFKRLSNSLRAGDVVIPVLGPTGPGKSTFINNVLGKGAKTRAKVSSGLESCTRTCEMFIVDGPLRPGNPDYHKISGRLVLVDTPGFDDSRMSDSEVVHEISMSLNSVHSKKGVSVAGIVYMLPIYPGRATASSKSNMKAFEKVYSQTSSPIVALVTTRWNLCSEAAGAKREAELCKNMWGESRADALVLRLQDQPESAWEVVDAIIRKFVEKQNTTQPVAGGAKGKVPATKKQSVSKHSSGQTAAGSGARDIPVRNKKGSGTRPSSSQPAAEATNSNTPVKGKKGSSSKSNPIQAGPGAKDGGSKGKGEGSRSAQQNKPPAQKSGRRPGIISRLVNALLSLFGRSPAGARPTK